MGEREIPGQSTNGGKSEGVPNQQDKYEFQTFRSGRKGEIKVRRLLTTGGGGGAAPVRSSPNKIV